MADVDEVVAALEAGRPAIVPTDTVYGLCARPDSEAAVAELFRLKGRPRTTPVALVCADLDALFERLPELDGAAAACARALLPGPFTLVVANPARRFPWLTVANSATLGVRVPAVRGRARAVLRRLGAVAATSANAHGGPDPRRLADVPAEIRRACAAVLDGGELPGVPSTVLDLTGAEPRVLREGAVPAAEAIALARAAAGRESQ